MTGLRLTVSVLVLLAATPALAQKIAPTRSYGQDPAQETYETPGYRPAPPPPVDKNYGLPTFGMKGTELPEQRTQTPKVKPQEPTDPYSTTPPDYTLKTPQPDQPDTPNFFGDAPPDFTLSPPPAPRDDAAGATRTAPTAYGNGGATGYSTGPAYTTRSQGDSDGYSTGGTASSTTETPLYTTSDGTTTGGDAATPDDTR
ncbi:hypothetical protein [Rhodopila globiformis]|uniref:hypothetical protein n=1 Tax=Rhodopila globiformis TaxID=1071 RepID=UPI0011B04E8D|nr:hypothetical protein [Rhodopila globiformis]